MSLAALNYRVHKLGIISDWKNRDFCIEIAKRGYNKQEPSGIEREKSVVWEKVLKTLWGEKTTHHDIANDLSVPVSEISDLLFGVLNTGGGGAALAPKPLAIVTEQDPGVPQANA